MESRNPTMMNDLLDALTNEKPVNAERSEAS